METDRPLEIGNLRKNALGAHFFLKLPIAHALSVTGGHSIFKLRQGIWKYIKNAHFAQRTRMAREELPLLELLPQSLKRSLNEDCFGHVSFLSDGDVPIVGI